MTESVEHYRLDPDDLDPIIADLDLREAGAIERLQAWYRDVLLQIRDWLRDATGGEDGWFDRLGDWIYSVNADNPINAEHVIDTITVITILLVVAGLAYLSYKLWQTFRPLESNQAIETTYLLDDPNLQRPLAELQAEHWAPALLAQVCVTLVGYGKLRLRPDATNATIARTADLPAELGARLSELATAADRSMFAGWVPTEEDAKALRDHRDQIINSIAARP